MTTRNVVAFGDEERDIEQDIGTEFGQIVSRISVLGFKLIKVVEL